MGERPATLNRDRPRADGDLCSGRMPNVHVLALHGEIDVSRNDATRIALQQLEGLGAAFVMIDLSEVSYIDTTFLNLLLELRKHLLDQGGETFVAIIAGPAGNVRRVFHITGLDTRFAIYDDLASARKDVVLEFG